MSDSRLKDNLRPPVHSCALVFGPSQYGKSTFINTILECSPIKEQQRAGVGSGNGESITISVKSYNIGIIPAMFPHLRPGYDTFQLIDVPGILDSGLRITKEEIFAEIKRILLQTGIQQIDALLVFESMKDDARKINISMEALMKYFGDGVKQSVIVLATKWDRVEEEESERITDYLENLINQLGLKYIKWQNNIKTRGRLLLTEEEVMNQIALLGAYIQRCRPYCVKEMDSLLLRRERLAEELRKNDPNRYVTEETEIEIDVPESYTETMNIPYTEFVPYTEAEINERAKRMQDADPGEPKITKTMIIVKSKSHVPETRSREVSTGLFGMWKSTVSETIYAEKEIETPTEVSETEMVPRKLEYFKAFYIGQGKAENRNREIPIEKVRFKKSTKMIPSHHERHEFSHYINLATQQLDEEIRNSIRINLV